MSRPEKWKPEYIRIAAHACKLGATDRDVAEMLNVSERTLYNWRIAKEGFAEALAVGKSPADDRVEQSLYRRATGYSFNAEKLFHYQGAVIRADYVEHIPPDTTACIFWLKNRRPDEWRDKGDGEGAAGIVEAVSKLIEGLPQ